MCVCVCVYIYIYLYILFTLLLHKFKPLLLYFIWTIPITFKLSFCLQTFFVQAKLHTVAIGTFLKNNFNLFITG